MNPIILSGFNQWVAWAQQDLSDLPPASEAPRSRACALKQAKRSLLAALEAANKLGCPARKALCLRVLNWLRADLRRLPA